MVLAEEKPKTVKEQFADAAASCEKLKPSRVDSGTIYEERSKRREQEFQSLQEALKTLQGDNLR